MDNIVEDIFQALKQNKGTLSIAESCTGGFLSHLITNVDGSSEFFKGGFVNYGVESKIRDLNIDPEIIKRYTVYSKEIAEAMAESIKQIFGSSIGLSTTGIAPPGDAESTEKTGKIWIGIASDYKTTSTVKIIETNERQEFKEKSAQIALEFLKHELTKT